LPTVPMNAAMLSYMPKWRSGVVAYFLLYLVIGCCLFSNYYPWT
jgi:hypothetical protein